MGIFFNMEKEGFSTMEQPSYIYSVVISKILISGYFNILNITAEYLISADINYMNIHFSL